MTALQRPLVVVNDLFQDSILDLSWNTDNHILLACSTDGTVACLQFAPEELGTPLSQENKVRIEIEIGKIIFLRNAFFIYKKKLIISEKKNIN